MKFFGAMVAITALAASLGACGQSEQQPNLDATKSAPAAPATALATEASGVMLTVQPAYVDGCKPDQSIVAKLNWHSNVTKVQVLVTNPGQPTRLFSESGFTGSAKTGDWVVAGTEFKLVDPATNHVLATRVVSVGSCASSSSAE